MLNKFKKPDLNAPRFRGKRLGLLNRHTINEFKKENPAYEDIDPNKLKKIIRIYNKRLWEGVIKYRDGVELPEFIGFLFLGTCPPAKRPNVNFSLSKEYGKPLSNRNWETDGNLGKIFYTNWPAKYKFRFRNLWSFQGTRDFKRAVAKEYPKNWTKYVKMQNKYRVAHLFKQKQ